MNKDIEKVWLKRGVVLEKLENAELDLEYKVFGTGEKILLIEIGIGSSIYNWFPFVKNIMKDFTIIMYHRAGYGSSMISKNPRTTKNISYELNKFIESLGIKEKVTIMGHSFGGLCALHYVMLFPDKVNGLILLDSTSPNFNRLYNLDIPVMNSLISIDQMVQSNLDNSYKSKEELRNLYNQSIDDCHVILTKNEVIRFEEFITNPNMFKTVAEEFQNWESSSESIKELGEFPNIPLTVIARDIEASVNAFVQYNIPEEEAVKYEKVWRELQIGLSQLSTKGELIIADHSDHGIHLDRPDIVIQGLKRFL
ncbi:alpha/beta fold hydrolase [Psychrobacillus sp.]|uniref:alpha/beta fold hydrolase n=1 Tax=Psychrobacillus sp. TaxID=1871623 RepID=UPI0028BE98C1|nr:alpha/beta fold hydrolase [Psychrobacillus sp.]